RSYCCGYLTRRGTVWQTWNHTERVGGARRRWAASKGWLLGTLPRGYWIWACRIHDSAQSGQRSTGAPRKMWVMTSASAPGPGHTSGTSPGGAAKPRGILGRPSGTVSFSTPESHAKALGYYRMSL